MSIQSKNILLAAMALPLLVMVGCKSMDSGCGCGGSTTSTGSSWTSWSPIFSKHGDQVVSSCGSCESSAPIAKSSSGKTTEPPLSTPRSHKIVVPDEKPRPLPNTPE